jgi:hypothetical protein
MASDRTPPTRIPAPLSLLSLCPFVPLSLRPFVRPSVPPPLRASLPPCLRAFPLQRLGVLRDELRDGIVPHQEVSELLPLGDQEMHRLINRARGEIH